MAGLKHRFTNRLSAAVLVAIVGPTIWAAGAAGAIPRAENDRALRDFVAERFPAVVRRLLPYDRDRPRRLSADFMMAVSKCRMGQTGDGRARLLRLQTEFWVTARKSRDIAAHIEDCGAGRIRIAGVDGKADGSDGKISPAALASPRNPQMSGLEPGLSYAQADIYSQRAESALECARVCLDDSRCRAMTYITSQRLCWIKDRVPSASEESSDMTSAVKLYE